MYHTEVIILKCPECENSFIKVAVDLDPYEIKIVLCECCSEIFKVGEVLA